MDIIERVFKELDWVELFDLKDLGKSILENGPRIILAIIILFIGTKVIGFIQKRIANKLIESKVDVSIQSFLKSIVKVLMYIVLLITVVAKFGIDVTTVIAILASASFTIGFALQGSLSNFAGGIILLILKPFKVGDYISVVPIDFIEAGEYCGRVKEITMFYTVLVTPDNKDIMLPNANVSNGSTTNHSVNKEKIMDLKIKTTYKHDTYSIKEMIKDMIIDYPGVIKEKTEENPHEIEVVLGAIGDDHLEFHIKFWCKTDEYWQIYYNLNEKIKYRLDVEGLSVASANKGLNIDVKK